MINEQIVGYVSTERARGVTDEAIRGALLAQGWKEEDVESAMGGGVPSVDTAIPRAFSFHNLFAGRLGRWQYFMTGLLASLVFIVIIIGAIFTDGEFIALTLSFSILAYIALFLLSLSLSIRRAHDIGWSGWVLLLFLVPFVGAIFSLVLLFKRGTDGANAYGAPQADRPFLRTLLNT